MDSLDEPSSDLGGAKFTLLGLSMKLEDRTLPALAGTSSSTGSTFPGFLIGFVIFSYLSLL